MIQLWRYIWSGKLTGRKHQSLRAQVLMEPPKRSPISKLPVELLLEIQALLPPESKLCLALSCKSFLGVLDSSKALRQSNKFRHPKNLDNPWCLPRRRDYFCTQRWQLLRFLENSRWRCCSGCLILHPISEFPARDLATEPENRNCIFGSLIGLVQLCPCIQMTFSR
jgi:hypothetical protein